MPTRGERSAGEAASAPKALFPIVGIGASAGGLEALEQFFAAVPGASGLAFVVVQHLDPTHKGILVELLQRSTALRVVQAKEGSCVRPNCVYVIPPNYDLSLLHGVLHLFEPAAPRGLRLPVDFFFRTLAEDQRERSVGIILSGMGGDGTLGLKAIKEAAGVALVQDPATAKFDGMPRSAVTAGLADIVAPASELPGKLLDYLRHAPLLRKTEPVEDRATESELAKVLVLLRSRTGHDFALYKRSTLYRRIERRMGLHQISKISVYGRYLRENPKEADLLFKELLIGVTSFFRDPAVWEELAADVLPALIKGIAAPTTLRAWVAGCSTGEEAYTLAVVFHETLTRLKSEAGINLRIFATDLESDAVDKARRGWYPASIAAEVSPERLKRYFVAETNGYRVNKAIRETVIFATQDIIQDPPFTKLDILTCRNLLIYFTSELQRKLLPMFHYSLKPGGVLVLGGSETIGGATRLFSPIHAKARLFRKEETAAGPVAVELPTALTAKAYPNDEPPPKPSPAPPSLQSAAEQWILQRLAPAAVLVNADGDILYVSGRIGRYLEPAMGKANWNVFAMVRESWRYALAKAFRAAAAQAAPVLVHQLAAGSGADSFQVDLSVQCLAEPKALSGLTLLVFTEVRPDSAAANPGKKIGKVARPLARVLELQAELARAQAEAQAVHEQMQTASEELKSLNEESQSTNEELQSTNEELTTSKEEMQSLNEELQTVNAELQAKLDELVAASTDMKNLLNSTEIATVFLDRNLRVRRFTEQATKLFNFIPGDVGRPVTDLATELLYPGLAADATEVLRRLISVDKEIATHAGRWLGARLMPYRTMDDRIDGVVITFNDITLAKGLEARLRSQIVPVETEKKP
jgi:two-component system CheB/CheR fusion protein